MKKYQETYPNCGCGGVPSVLKRRFGKYRYFVRCSLCFTRTDSAKTPGSAIAFWRLVLTGKED